ncbi:MAG: hypothetical protein KA998_00210 [Rickettsiaceae bacterium]|nr:hypothetical protein [Rickettsiaceae bacterium]
MTSFILLLALFYAFAGLCDYESPTVRTNLNEKNDFFENAIPDHNDLKQMLESHKNSYGAERNGVSGLSGVIDLNDSSILSEVEELKAGNKVIPEEEANEIMSMHTDLTDPLLQRDKSDLEEIAEDTSKSLGNLITSLKDIGIDCKEDEKKEVVPSFYKVEKINYVHTNKLYDKALCEELKNQYKCTDILTVECVGRLPARPLTLDIIETDLPIIRNQDGYLQAGSYDRHWLYGGSGWLYRFVIKFNIAKVSAIESFILQNIGYDDFVLLELNGSYVFSGPFGGHKLELIYGGVRVDDSGRLHNPEQSKWWSSPPRPPSLPKDLKPFLKDGVNSLNFTVVVGGKGGLLFGLYMSQKVCNQWKESWSEQCVLK